MGSVPESRVRNDSPLEEGVSCELVSGNPNFILERKSRCPKPGKCGILDRFSGLIWRTSCRPIWRRIKDLGIFAPYTRVRCARARPPRFRALGPWWGSVDEPIGGGPLPHWKAPPRFYKGSTPTFGERSKARLAKPYSTQIVIPIFN